MPNYGIEHIRNVVLLSHSGAGKTSLSEAMLFASGVITRLGKVDEGTTTSDYEPEEVKRKISINLSLLPCPWKGTKINIIDTPGYSDFVGEVKAGLRVSEGAIIVICAASGLEVGTEQVWGYAEERELPRIVLINKMDRENADFYRTLDDIQAKLGRKCIPIQLPIGAESDFSGVVNLLSLKSYRGTRGEEGEIPASLQDQVASFREKLIEAAAEINDELITKYLEGMEITTDELSQGLREGARTGKIVPVLVCSALQNIGIAPLLDAICEYLPSPADVGTVTVDNLLSKQKENIGPDPKSPLVSLVFKTSADPYVGKLTYFRVYAGSIHSNSQVWNVTKNAAERIGQLFVLRGKTQEPVTQLVAGDIGAVAKLAVTSTGDTIADRDHPVVVEPVRFPLPALSMAVRPKSKADLDKMGAALPRLAEEDPTIQVHRDPDTNETIISGIGETHLEVTTDKMQRKFGAEISLDLPQVPYKETITVPVTAEYKHKKQTGGHGQYGHVCLRLEPLPRGTGFEFADKVVGGTVPKNYIPAVEKGVNEAKHEGVLARCPIVDIKVTLYDGSYHSVDSSEISFKIAAAQALKKGLSQGQPVLLEPVVNLRITVPESFTGDIISDLNAKRAKVLGMTPQDGSNVIKAQVPQAEILRYAIDLRSITQGRGSYTAEFSHYEEVPVHIVQKITAERQAERG